MFEINLLPWRQIIRANSQRKLRNKTMLSSLVSILVIYCWHYTLLHHLHHVTITTTQLQQQLSALQKHNGNPSLTTLENSINLIAKQHENLNNLLGDRHLNTLLLGEFSKIAPHNLYYFALSKTDADITINGKAETISTIAELINNINHSKVLHGAELINSKNDVNDRTYSFIIKTHYAGAK